MKPLPEYVVSARVSIPVPATGYEEAKEVAEQYLNRYGLAIEKIYEPYYNWKPHAADLLEEGYSQSEVARELGIDRSYISKAFPGTGMSHSEGGQIGQLLAKLNNPVYS